MGFKNRLSRGGIPVNNGVLTEVFADTAREIVASNPRCSSALTPPLLEKTAYICVGSSPELTAAKHWRKAVEHLPGYKTG